MGLFGWLFGNNKEQGDVYDDPDISDYLTDESFEEYSERKIAESLENDYLGFAAIASKKAEEAEKNKDHDKAWGLLHDVQTNYLEHAERNNFTVRQTLELIGPIYKRMANILRKEGKHLDAMSNIIYWAACNSRQKKEQEMKVPAYFKRLKCNNKTLDDLLLYIESIKGNPDLRQIKKDLREWD